MFNSCTIDKKKCRKIGPQVANCADFCVVKINFEIFFSFSDDTFMASSYLMIIILMRWAASWVENQ